MKLISSYIKPLWFSIIIVSLLSLLNVAGTLYIPTLTATIINDGVLHGDLEMITNSSATMLIVALLTVSSAILGVAMSGSYFSLYRQSIARQFGESYTSLFTTRLYTLWYRHHTHADQSRR